MQSPALASHSGSLASHSGSEPNYPHRNCSLCSLQNHQMPRREYQAHTSRPRVEDPTLSPRASRPTSVQCIMSLRHITRHGCHDVRITPANVTEAALLMSQVAALANLSSVHFASKRLQLRGSGESLGISRSQGQETRRKTSSQGLPR